MKEQNEILKAEVIYLITNHFHPRPLTEQGRINRRVHNDMMVMHKVGYSNTGGVDYRVTAQPKGR